MNKVPLPLRGETGAGVLPNTLVTPNCLDWVGLVKRLGPSRRLTMDDDDDDDGGDDDGCMMEDGCMMDDGWMMDV